LRLIPDPDCENFERALQFNTIDPFQLIKAVIGSMILRQTRVIVNKGCSILDLKCSIATTLHGFYSH
jgi:hypothetical protein